jgi:glycosyltransferase involved in cell wall biosynthesis
MAPVNIAGQPIIAVRELRRLGVDASLLQYTLGQGHAFGYEQDRTFDLRGRHRVEGHAEALASTLGDDFDIYHFWMATFFAGRRYVPMFGLDLPFLKSRGKRIVYRGTGFDLRVRSEHIARNPHNPFAHGYELDTDEELQRKYLAYLRDYVDLFIVQDPEMREYMPGARVVPRAIDLDSWPEAGIRPTGRPLVVHAPSNTKVKGTAIIEAAVGELKQEGLSFDFKLVTGMQHSEAIDWYRRADVVVDQILLGWYGVVTIEALALGKPVIVYVREDLYADFTPRIPIQNANPDTFKEALRDLIVDFDARRKLSEDARSFVAEVHDARRVAASLRDIYEELMQQPLRVPETTADLDWFVTQYKALEAREEFRIFKAKARRHDKLLQTLPELRAKAARHDRLLETLPELKAKAGRYDKLLVTLPDRRAEIARLEADNARLLAIQRREGVPVAAGLSQEPEPGGWLSVVGDRVPRLDDVALWRIRRLWRLARRDPRAAAGVVWRRVASGRRSARRPG